ncbi:K02A2.6-like [Cordylochernes scorpioides]|uniref:K02A2.6-like n=1 Tax=Cordylochernes scorpioides TaxID=51811 RepID=A0ABY6KVX8_9ARAC|nr:K02A2.6-like [Cordylochernes scorpioides]
MSVLRSSSGVTRKNNKWHFKHMRDQVIEKVKNMRRPYNLKSLQCFTGLTGHFRPYISNYAMIIRPLDALKRKDSIFTWTKECEESYLKLLTLISSNPILRIPDCSLQYELSTDASYYGTGAVLYQRDITEKKNRQLRVISYYSYTFTRAEQNYSVTEKECLAVLKAVKHFRAYLECKPFTVHTDHLALTQLLSCGNLRDRLARWQLFLSSFEMNINHRSGKELQDADALSRLAIDSPTDPNESILWTNHRSIDLKLGDNNRHPITKTDSSTDPHTSSGAVYSVSCQQCPATYVGETGRTIAIRMTEHTRNITNRDTRSLIFQHIASSGHSFDTANPTIHYKNISNLHQRLVLESIVSSKLHSINRKIDIPAAYTNYI